MYRPWAEIHHDRLRANFAGLAKHVGGAKVLAVVKANGYGHGMLPVARTLAAAGAFGFGVAILEEALTLREGGIDNPILHMGRFDPQTLAAFTRHNITLTIHSREDIDHLEAYCQATGEDMTAHLKIDTGMGRLGVPYADAVEVLEKLRTCDFIRLEGIYSHFATADEEEPSFMRYQHVRFAQFVHMVQKLRLQVDYFHTANSAAVVREAESHFNMVRPGLLLYGLSPSPAVQPPFPVAPVMDLKAPLVMVKSISEGAPVGYGRTYRATRATHIGTLQIGYHDGLPLSLSGKGYVGLDGAVYPLAGRVSMDLCAVDFGDANPPLGSAVLIWGEADDPRLNVAAQAVLAGTNSYALLTQLGNRVELRHVNA